MTGKTELNQRNYKRISLINWLLCVPLIVLFAWPYLYFAEFLSLSNNLAYAGSLLFAFPFMLTILHGHVTMALGSPHRHHYYEWLEQYNLTYGLFFHSLFTSTRFRLILVISSLAVLAVGSLLEF